MSNALTIARTNMGALSTKFAAVPAENDLGAGISGGFGRIGYKGKVWSTNYRGDTHLLMRSDEPDAPMASIEVVILKASNVISKTWYKDGYIEGSVAPPDCLSSNGLTPNANSPLKQAPTCALCPKNKFGSQIKQDGTAGKGKACSDTKRLAVVPLPDINNEMLGGPMLLRVPAASLNDTAAYGAAVNKLGYHYFAVGTRISFDAKESFPKFIYNPIRALTDDEAELVLAHREDPRIDRILAEDVVPAAAPAEPEKPAIAFEQPPAQPAAVQPAVAPVVAPVAQPAAATPKVTAPRPSRAKPAAAPAAAPTGGFGGTPTPAPATAAAPAVASSPVQPSGLEAPADSAEFDAALEAQLEGLMGKAAA